MSSFHLKFHNPLSMSFMPSVSKYEDIGTLFFWNTRGSCQCGKSDSGVAAKAATAVPIASAKRTAEKKRFISSLVLDYFYIFRMEPSLASVRKLDVLPCSDLVDYLHLSALVQDEEVLGHFG